MKGSLMEQTEISLCITRSFFFLKSNKNVHIKVILLREKLQSKKTGWEEDEEENREGE